MTAPSSDPTFNPTCDCLCPGQNAGLEGGLRKMSELLLQFLISSFSKEALASPNPLSLLCLSQVGREVFTSSLPCWACRALWWGQGQQTCVFIEMLKPPLQGGVGMQGRPFSGWLDIKSHLALKDSQEQMEPGTESSPNSILLDLCMVNKITTEIPDIY